MLTLNVLYKRIESQLKAMPSSGDNRELFTEIKEYEHE